MDFILKIYFQLFLYAHITHEYFDVVYYKTWNTARMLKCFGKTTRRGARNDRQSNRLLLLSLDLQIRYKSVKFQANIY